MCSNWRILTYISECYKYSVKLSLGENIMKLEDLKMFKYVQVNDNTLAEQIKTIYHLTSETINNISKSFDNFTMHDMNHGLRVASYMEQLAFGIGEDFDCKIAKFNAFEITLMILSAILHDIGMTIREEDKTAIKNNAIKYSNELTFEGVLKVTNNNETEAIKEIIRRTHAARIYEFIDYEFDNRSINDILLLDNNYPYAEDVAEICKAHGEEHSYLNDLSKESTKGKYSYNLQYIAALLRLADYLDLDKSRTPVLWFRVMEIEGFSKEEWEKHFIIHNVTKLKDYIDGKLQVYFDGRSENAKIHRKYLAYIDDIKVELENSDNLLNTKTADGKYKFNISTKIDDRVKTIGFTYSDLRLNLDYAAITELLMGRNIYGDPRLGLRELIQNSIDACELMKEICEINEDLILVDPEIIVSISKNKNTVKIKDTGIGMSLEIVKKHFLNVGKSYYKSNEYLFENHQYQPIGQYGIGFLACFLLSDNVVVKTRHYLSAEINQIELEKNSEYVVTNTHETPNFCGTEIKLEYDKFFNVFKNEHELQKFLEKYFFTQIPITIRDEDSRSSIKIQNTCSDKIETVLSLENKSSKYMVVNCKDYSEKITGKLYLNNIKTKKFIVDDVDKKNSYFYNFEEEKFQKSKNNDGFYCFCRYPIISVEEYNQIASKSKRNDAGFCKEVLAYAEKNGGLSTLFFPVDVADFNSFFRVQYEGYFKNRENVFKKIKLEYFEKILKGYANEFRFCFVKGDRKIELFNASLADSRYFYDNVDDAESHASYVYNKGILVMNYGVIRSLLPVNVQELLGVVNCVDLPVKLDVSRNRIIRGKKDLVVELNTVLLKYIQNHKASPELDQYIDRMIICLKETLNN